MRTAVWILPAILVGFALLWGMQAMIGMEGRLEESRGNYQIDFVRLRQDTEVETKRREIPKKLQQEEPPPIPSVAKSVPRPGSELGEPLAILDTALEIDDAPDELALAVGEDTDIVPLVRVEPIYPPKAQQLGLTGWVEVVFTITAAGTVRDPVVVAHEPSGIFDRAALRAIRKWKYAPRIENGKPVERHNVGVRLEFRMRPKADEA